MSAMHDLEKYINSDAGLDVLIRVALIHYQFEAYTFSIRRLCEMGILTQNSGVQRNRTFPYSTYLDILREGTV